ncbi:MAG: hypothetical protein LBS18_06595 [Clostridiales bacterium]|nr:hypothetical protein [Clostridiales bacterium]
MKKRIAFFAALLTLLSVAAMSAMADSGTAAAASAPPAPPAWVNQGVFAANEKTDGLIGANEATHWLALDDAYIVCKQKNGNYIVFYQDNALAFTGGDAPLGALFRIEKDSRHRTTALYMYGGTQTGPLYRVYGNKETGEVGFICVGSTVNRHNAGDIIVSGDKGYKALLQLYETHFEDALELSVFREGNLLKDSDWIERACRGDIMASVRIGARG